MKPILIFFFLCLAITFKAQTNIDNFIKEAQGFLAQKNYKQAQLSLQDAINELNNMMAKQVSEAIPAKLGDLVATGDGEIVNMNAMGVGSNITKNYKHPTKPELTAEILIMSNSPMLSSLNMLISNPSMMGQGYKSGRLGSRRVIIKTDMNDFTDDKGVSKQIRSTEIQIPMNQTLISIKTNGFATEAEELAFAGKLDLEKIKGLLGE